MWRLFTRIVFLSQLSCLSNIYYRYFSMHYYTRIRVRAFVDDRDHAVARDFTLVFAATTQIFLLHMVRRFNLIVA